MCRFAHLPSQSRYKLVPWYRSPVFSFYTHSHFPSSFPPNLCQPLIFPSSLQFRHFSNAIYCRNHAVWTFEVDFLHSDRFPWDPFKLLCVSTVCSSALLSSSPWCECISFFPYLPIEGCFDCFVFWILYPKLLWTSVYRLFENRQKSFSGINTQEFNCWVIW